MSQLLRVSGSLGEVSTDRLDALAAVRRPLDHQMWFIFRVRRNVHRPVVPGLERIRLLRSHQHGPLGLELDVGRFASPVLVMIQAPLPVGDPTSFELPVGMARKALQLSPPQRDGA